jgi:hypothetical protein
LALETVAIARTAIKIDSTIGAIALAPNGSAEATVALILATIGGCGAFFAIRFARGSAANAIGALL